MLTLLVTLALYDIEQQYLLKVLLLKSSHIFYILRRMLIIGLLYDLGPVHTYPEIFVSANFFLCGYT